jgi:predicted permease
MLIQIFSIISPVFICAFLGYCWGKFQHPFDREFVTRIITNISAPCLVFATFMEASIDMQPFLSVMAGTFLNVFIVGLIAFLILRVLNFDLHAFLPSQMFPNTGNMGLPLCLLAFGDEGLALGITYFAVNSFFHFTIGVAISRGSMSLKDMARSPMFFTVILTLILVYFNVKAPVWIINTTELLAGIAIPLMLIALGVSLSQFKVSSIRRSIGLSALRLSLGFVVGLSVAQLLGLEGVAWGVMVIQSSMPVAVFSYLFAFQNQRSPEEVAGTVVFSTLLSFISLPLLLWFVLP